MPNHKSREFHPRNSLVTIRKLTVSETKQVGKIILPNTYGDFAFAEIIRVGPGTVESNGERHDTEDLTPGDMVLIRSGRSMNTPQGKVTEKNSLTFNAEDEEFDILNQSDIIMIVRPEPIPGV